MVNILEIYGSILRFKGIMWVYFGFLENLVLNCIYRKSFIIKLCDDDIRVYEVSNIKCKGIES